MSKVRVVIIDDHAMVRQGLRAFLGLNESLEVVGEASNGEEGVVLVSKVKPDVALMDLIMPVMNGIEATRAIQELENPPKVLVLTSFIEDDKVFPALEAGAHGYLLKDISPDALAQAILATHRGDAQLHPQVTKKLMKQVLKPAKPSKTPASQHVDTLTHRELEVLGLISQGFNNKKIAKELHISLKTVKTHVSSILAKLDVEDRTQAAIYAIKHGLTP